MLDASIARIAVLQGQSIGLLREDYFGLDQFTLVNAQGGVIEQAYVALRDGDSLILIYADGTQVILTDYFLGDAVLVLEGVSGATALPQNAPPMGLMDDLALLSFGGRADLAAAILAETPRFSALQSILASQTLAFTGEGAVGGSLNAISALSGIIAAGALGNIIDDRKGETKEAPFNPIKRFSAHRAMTRSLGMGGMTPLRAAAAMTVSWAMTIMTCCAVAQGMTLWMARLAMTRLRGKRVMTV